MRGLRLVAIFAAVLLITVGARAEDFKVGFVGPLSGQYSGNGGLQLKALQASIDEINAKNVAGVHIDLIIGDDAADPRTANDVCNRFALSDKVGVVISADPTPPRVACIQALNKAGIPLIGATPAPSKLCFAGLFILGPELYQSYFPLGAPMAAKGWKKMYAIGSDSAGPRDNAVMTKADWEGRGGTIVKQVFTPNNTADFSAQLSEIASLKPDVVFSTLQGADDTTFHKQYVNDPRVAAIPRADDLFDGPEARAAGPAAKGVMGTTAYSASFDYPMNAAFKAALAKATDGKVPPDMWGMFSYEAGYLLADVLKGGARDPKAIQAALLAAKFDSPTGQNEIHRHYTQLSMFQGTFDETGTLVIAEHTKPFPSLDNRTCD